MATYKTPGVYVEEITTLPPSVAEVETAIPAFMGFTEKGIPNEAVRISSLKEYEDLFGRAEIQKGITAELEVDPKDPQRNLHVANVTIDPAAKATNVMYYAMQLYFGNGGGPCYIIPAGNYGDESINPPVDTYIASLQESSKEDEPTLLVFPDAPFKLEAADYYQLMNQALLECNRLGDRFAIIDVVDDGNIESSVKLFRDTISSNPNPEVKYGAAYYPYLNTSLNIVYDTVGGDGINVFVPKDPKADDVDLQAKNAKLTSLNNELAALQTSLANKKAEDPTADTKTLDGRIDKKKGEITQAQQAVTDAQSKGDVKAFSDNSVREVNNLIRNQIKKMIADLPIRLSPCAAVAGVYASVDTNRGVWKAPANVTLNYVSSVNTKITDSDQRDLNIDVVAGKSVNAIRSFVGMGTKIWGARTLDGNGNEWRYVSVRRFFNMVEESVKKSTYWAVFEPNDVNTWTRVRAMVENYLLLKWKDGALMGTKPDEAFFVRVGLGQTMSPQDILEGRMIIEIGMAAVRPAEFIILRFSHFVQKA